MKIKSLNDLNNENSYMVDESLLIKFGYYTDKDDFKESYFNTILQKIYKKSNELGSNEPRIITFLNGFILSKIWIEGGRINREDGKPAEIIYDENGVTDRNWYISGRCINDEIAFICIKNKKDRQNITKEDIDYIKDFFKIK